MSKVTSHCLRMQECLHNIPQDSLESETCFLLLIKPYMQQIQRSLIPVPYCLNEKKALYGNGRDVNPSCIFDDGTGLPGTTDTLYFFKIFVTYKKAEIWDTDSPGQILFPVFVNSLWLETWVCQSTLPTPKGIRQLVFWRRPSLLINLSGLNAKGSSQTFGLE